MKIKLKDMTEEQYKKWYDTNPHFCVNCPFFKSNCGLDDTYCWVINKDLYSDKFLNQEIEIIDENEPILTDEEREYLSNVIRPFRDNVEWVIKHSENNQFIEFRTNDDTLACFLIFEKNKYYENMESSKKYTLEELGL